MHTSRRKKMLSWKLLFGISALMAGLAQAGAEKTVFIERLGEPVASESDSRRYLRSSSPNSQQIFAQNHRELQTIFSIPFSLQWRIAIGNGYPNNDRQPTAEEYEGVRVATIDWLDKAIANQYSNATAFSFVDATCQLQSQGTSWQAAAPDNYPHKILLHCEAFFSAASLSDIPSANDFIADINKNYDFRNFVENYLWQAQPQSNLFRYSQRVGYVLSNIGPAGPVTTAPASSMPAPAPTSSMPAPAPAPSMPAPAPAPSMPAPPLAMASSQPTPGFTGRYVLPFTVAFSMDLFNGSNVRKPTENDYQGLKSAVVSWFTDSIESVYAKDSASFTLDTFIANITSSTFKPGAEFPYVVRFDCFAVFNADALNDLPTVIQFLRTVSSQFGFTSLIEHYIHVAPPDGNVFRDTARLRYASGTTTPAGAVNPGEPIAPPPTMTPAPVMTSGPMVGQTSVPVAAAPIPSPTISAPVSMPTMTIPVPVSAPASTMPAPTTSAPSTSASVPMMPTAVNVVDFITQWEFTIGYNFPDRQPTAAEYEAYRVATQRWLTKVYKQAYNDNASTPTVSKVQVFLLSSSYNPNKTPAHNTTLQTEITFMGDQPVPSMHNIYGVLRDANLMNYMVNYLQTITHPKYNIFTGVSSVKWNRVMGPTSAPGSAPSPTMGMPSATPTNTSPTSMPVPAASPVSGPGIVDTAIAAGQFTTLVDLLSTAGLVNTLRSPGPFTVFAPTDAAFAAAIPDLQAFKQSTSKQELRSILLYHVVPGIIRSSDFMNGLTVASAEGSNLTISSTSNGTMVNDADIITPDIEASNGIIDVIDKVLIPPDIAPPGNSANLTHLVTVPIVMTLDLAIDTDLYSGSMQPTEAESNGLLMATKRFLTNALADMFSSQQNTDFVGLLSITFESTFYTAGATLPYSVEVSFSLAFMQGSTVLSASEYWYLINSLDVTNFISKYIWLADPVGSIFHYTTNVQWGFVNA